MPSEGFATICYSEVHGLALLIKVWYPMFDYSVRRREVYTQSCALAIGVLRPLLGIDLTDYDYNVYSSS